MALSEANDYSVAQDLMQLLTQYISYVFCVSIWPSHEAAAARICCKGAYFCSCPDSLFSQFNMLCNVAADEWQ